MMDWIRREAIYLWYYLEIQVRQIAPYWALGILLGSAVSVFGKRYIHGAFARIGQRKMGSGRDTGEPAGHRLAALHGKRIINTR